jgi:thioredoxin reductase (NADPH)
VLRNPDIHALAEFLEMNPAMDDAKVHDLVVIGAGPAGLAAAVYGASEGLDVRVVEIHRLRRARRSSSKIENYLGLPDGISGGALAGTRLRAGAEVRRDQRHRRRARRCAYVSVGRRLRDRADSDGSQGAGEDGGGGERREVSVRLKCAELQRFVGLGVLLRGHAHGRRSYAAARKWRSSGGGNSAGQAVVCLATELSPCAQSWCAGRASREHVSRYLIRRIEDNPLITHAHAHRDREGGGRRPLERVTWRQKDGPARDARYRAPVSHDRRRAEHRWLEGCVALDAKGFVRTGIDLGAEELAAAGWPLARAPYLLETTRPGVFAAGDVRSGSVKRVASAVGEGSSCVQFVHRVLAS